MPLAYGYRVLRASGRNMGATLHFVSVVYELHSWSEKSY